MKSSPVLITGKTRIGRIMKIPELRKAAPYFSGGAGWLLKRTLSLTTPDSLHKLNPSTNPESLVIGLRGLLHVAEQNMDYLHAVYDPEEIQRDKRLVDVKLFHYPGQPGKPFVFLCAGGGFTCVSSYTEAFPTAARLQELGYSVFILNYRIDRRRKGRAAAIALEDIAVSMRYILRNKGKLGLDGCRYAMGGFSAGGYLTVLWGTKEYGYAKFGLPKPEVLFPVYPFVSPILWPDKGNDPILNRILGKNYTDANKYAWDPLHLIDGEYPPSYINCCRDDSTVSFSQSERLAESLRAHEVRCELLLGEYGGHGYGDGRGTDAEGWIDKVIHFWKYGESDKI